MGLSAELIRRIEEWLQGKPTGSLTLEVKEGRVMKPHITEYWRAEGEVPEAAPASPGEALQ